MGLSPPDVELDGTSARGGGARDVTPVEDLPGRRGSRALLRDLNVSLLIELVRRFGTISRAELARQSQLSPPTVSVIVALLLEREIFTEVALAPSSGGRPPVLLRLNPTAGYVVGIKLRGDGLTTVVCDLDARVTANGELAATLVDDPAAAIEAIAEATRSVLADAGVKRSKVLGVGIGLSGVIDSNGGTCRFSHLLRWEDVPLAEPLRRRLRLPVWVDNDVKTLAIAEKWVGDGVSARDFVTLSIGRGIGLGIVIDRALYRGATGGAGELGHVVIDPDGPACECGRQGCLEAFVGEPALCRQLGARLGRVVSRDELIELVRAGDKCAAEIVGDAGRTLGLAVANVATLLNPEMLIVCGEGTELGQAFFEPFVDTVHERTFPALGRELDIKIQQWGNEVWAVGAATLVLRELFSLPSLDDRGRAIWHRLEAR